MAKGATRWGAPLAVLAGVSALAATSAALLLGRGSTGPRTAPPSSSPIQWLGGSSRLNIDGLAFMFATENDDGSLLLWALQALSANNFARQLARTDRRIDSIGSMLQSGLIKTQRPYRRVYDLGWGRQYDKVTRITRWAGTARGLSPLTVSWVKFEFAEKLLTNRVDFLKLVGKRGETMPPSAEWTQINSFLQYEGFGRIVQKQAGAGAEQDPDKVIASWGSPRLVIAAEGLRFFAAG
mgnify:CR=1 FL=1